jgi:plastocyanin
MPVHLASNTKWGPVLAGLAIVGLSACSAAASRSSLAPAPPTTAMAGMATTAVAAAPAPSATAPAAASVATIHDFAFTPATVTVRADTTVTWTNNDSVDHTVTADAGRFGSSALGTKRTFAFSFTTPGTYSYHCSIHPFMHGSVVVTP